MKTIIKQIVEKEKQKEKSESEAIKAEIADPKTANDRRSFLKKAALGGIALGGLMNLSIEDTIAHTTQRVQRASAPSDLKITDLRYAALTVAGSGSIKAIIRIDTNQGIYGLGEVRDGADPRYALILKSRILGLNPCNVEMIFKIIKQFGYHGRQGGGVCGVEMALWDLCGKAYNVPAWQLLGGRYRDKIRLYANTTPSDDPAEYGRRMKERVDTMGFTWLKMDFGIGLVANEKDTLVNNKFWADMPANDPYSSLIGTRNTKHPFTQIQITEKGLDKLAAYVEGVRNAVGYEIPLGSDHYGHFDLNNAIRLGRAVEKYRLAWLEDMIPWFYTDQWKTISDAIETPTLTGEDIYCLKPGFKELIDAQAVDIIHPDLATSGGLLETKRIGDYAEENGVAMAMHYAGTPVSFMANVHCAAATQNFLSLEHHSVDVMPQWLSMVRPTGKQPLFDKGYTPVPLDSPGLGIELNDEVCRKLIHPQFKGYFEPTDEWNERRGNDRLWS
jgi:L-alanine-DL-glutamate epimerase-like enolase superfamily enzyme